MAKKRTVPREISPLVWGFLLLLKKKGVKIKSAYLFGSWAKGTQHRWSDIDLAIFSPEFTGWRKTSKLMNKALGLDFCRIEPHGLLPKDFKDKTNPLVDEIRKYGVKVI